MKKLILFSFIAVTFMTSCKKDFMVPTNVKTVDPTQTKEIKVADNFTWTTNVSMDITINPANTGILLVQDEKANAIHKAMVTAGETYTASITIPSATAKIYLYFNGQKEEISNVRSTKFTSNLK